MRPSKYNGNSWFAYLITFLSRSITHLWLCIKSNHKIPSMGKSAITASTVHCWLPTMRLKNIAPVSTRNFVWRSFIFKSIYILASLLKVLTPKYARWWLRICFLLVRRCVAANFTGVSSVCGHLNLLLFYAFHFPVTFLTTFETLSILFDVTASGISLGTSLNSFNFF